jgi:predicted dehydrogenase
VKAALLAGKHVVCEKPLTMKASEAQELVKLAAEKKLVNAVNHNIRFYPLAQQAHAMIKNGEIGNVYIIQGSYLQDWLLLDTDWNWRLEPELGGDMRAVADIGSHWLDLLTFIADLKIVEVCADFSTFCPFARNPRRKWKPSPARFRQLPNTTKCPSAPKTTPRCCCTLKTACAAC